LAARDREKKTRSFRVESAIVLFTRRVLALFRVNPAKSFDQPVFFYPERLFLSIVGSTLGKPGETGRRGRRNKSKHRRVLFSRYLSVNDAPRQGFGLARSIYLS